MKRGKQSVNLGAGRLGDMYKIIIILILLIILFYMARRAARAWIESKPEEAAPGKDVMVQDPVCKVYVTAGIARNTSGGKARNRMKRQGFCSLVEEKRLKVIKKVTLPFVRLPMV
jgi:flagellar basal body-associated protein FliL